MDFSLNYQHFNPSSGFTEWCKNHEALIFKIRLFVVSHEIKDQQHVFYKVDCLFDELNFRHGQDAVLYTMIVKILDC